MTKNKKKLEISGNLKKELIKKTLFNRMWRG